MQSTKAKHENAFQQKKNPILIVLQIAFMAENYIQMVKHLQTFRMFVVNAFAKVSPITHESDCVEFTCTCGAHQAHELTLNNKTVVFFFCRCRRKNKVVFEFNEWIICSTINYFCSLNYVFKLNWSSSSSFSRLHRRFAVMLKFSRARFFCTWHTSD